MPGILNFKKLILMSLCQLYKELVNNFHMLILFKKYHKFNKAADQKDGCMKLAYIIAQSAF